MNREKPASDMSKIEDPEGLATTISDRYGHSPGLVNTGAIDQFWTRTPGSGTRSFTEALMKKYELKSETKGGRTPLVLARHKTVRRRTSDAMESAAMASQSVGADWPMLVNPLPVIGRIPIQQPFITQGVVPSAGRALSAYGPASVLTDLIRRSSWRLMGPGQREASVQTKRGSHVPARTQGLGQERSIDLYGSTIGDSGEAGSWNGGSDPRVFRVMFGVQNVQARSKGSSSGDRASWSSEVGTGRGFGTPSVGSANVRSTNLEPPQVASLSAESPLTGSRVRRTVKLQPHLTASAALESLPAYQRMQLHRSGSQSPARYDAAMVPIQVPLGLGNSRTETTSQTPGINRIFRKWAEARRSDSALSHAGASADLPGTVALHAADASVLQQTSLQRASSGKRGVAQTDAVPQLTGSSQSLGDLERSLPATVVERRGAFDEELGRAHHDTFSGTLSPAMWNGPGKRAFYETPILSGAQAQGRFLRENPALILSNRTVATRLFPGSGTTFMTQRFPPLINSMNAGSSVWRAFRRAADLGGTSPFALTGDSRTSFAPLSLRLQAPGFLAARTQTFTSTRPEWSRNSETRIAAQPNLFFVPDVERGGSDWMAMAGPEQSASDREFLPATLNPIPRTTWSALQLPIQTKFSSLPEQLIGRTEPTSPVSLTSSSVAELRSFAGAEKSPFASASRIGTFRVPLMAPQERTLSRRAGDLWSTATNALAGVADSGERWSRSSQMGNFPLRSAAPGAFNQVSTSDQRPDLHLPIQLTNRFATWLSPRAGQSDSFPTELLRVEADKSPGMASARSGERDLPLALKPLLMRGTQSNTSATVQPKVSTDSAPASTQSTLAQRETVPALPASSPMVPQGQPGTATSNPTSAQAGVPGGGDIDELVEKISRRLLRQLIVEQERRGVSRWV